MLTMDDADLIAKIGKKRYRRRQERERYFTQAVDLSAVSSSMSTTTAGNKLAQEISEEFLTCKICLEAFKSPKSLDCLHTFCESCIESHVLSEYSYKKYSDYREFTCPLCRKRTQLPLGGVKKLPDNFLVSSLGEVVARQKPSKFPFCDICKLVSRKHREAGSKCLDCNKLLCRSCVDTHRETKVTKNHSIFDCDIEKDIECKEHQEEVVRFFCEPCETCICVLCTFNEHKDHEITQFAQAVPKYKEGIQNLLDTCKSKTDTYDRQLETLSQCQTFIQAAEQRIHEAAIQFIADIRSREKQLVDDLHGMYGPELMERVRRQDEMRNNLESLKSTCNLTELVLQGKDMELLLLKKQVQDKLTSLAMVTLADLPSAVHKHVAFVPGSVDLGDLCDQASLKSSNNHHHRKNNLLHNHHHSNHPHLHSQLSLPTTTSSSSSSSSSHSHSQTQTTSTTASTSSSADMEGFGGGRLVSRYIQTQPHSSSREVQEEEEGGEENGEGEGQEGGASRRRWGRVGGGLKSTVGTGTDLICTQEKGVSTQVGVGVGVGVEEGGAGGVNASRTRALLRQQRRLMSQDAANSVDTDGTPTPTPNFTPTPTPSTPTPTPTNPNPTSSSSSTSTSTSAATDPCSSPSARRARRRRERAMKEGYARGTDTGSCPVGPVLSYSSSIDENHYG